MNMQDDIIYHSLINYVKKSVGLPTYIPNYKIPKEYRLKKKIALQWMQNDCCAYCFKKFNNNLTDKFTIDHVTPKFYAGTDSWDNLIAACSKCNYTKGNTKFLTYIRRHHNGFKS